MALQLVCPLVQPLVCVCLISYGLESRVPVGILSNHLTEPFGHELRKFFVVQFPIRTGK